MVDIPGISCFEINPLEGDGSVGPVPVTIFEVNPVSGVTAEVRSVVGIVMVWRLMRVDEHVGPLHHLA